MNNIWESYDEKQPLKATMFLHVAANKRASSLDLKIWIEKEKRERPVQEKQEQRRKNCETVAKSEKPENR